MPFLLLGLNLIVMVFLEFTLIYNFVIVQASLIDFFYFAQNGSPRVWTMVYSKWGSPIMLVKINKVQINNKMVSSYVYDICKDYLDKFLFDFDRS